MVHTKELILEEFSVLKVFTRSPCMVEYTSTVPAEVPMATRSLCWCEDCLFFFFLPCCSPAQAKQVDTAVRWVEGENWWSS